VAGAGPGAPCGVPGTSQIPRLTNAQYDRTVRDLLGVTGLAAYNALPPSAVLASDSTGPLTTLAWNSYLAVAQAIAAQVIADPTLRPRFLACTPVGDGADCLHDTIILFGRRAFRRPLTVAEVARFDKIVAARARITKTGAPSEVAEALLQTFLASPSFIQRSELSTSPAGQGRFTLSSYEVASRLSYMLWGSAPDELLNQAADADKLVSREQIRDQAVRMMADPRAAQTLSAFHRYYIGADTSWQWTSTPAKDAARFPSYSEAFIAAARAETDRFFTAVAFDQKGTFQDLLSSPQAFVTRETAPIYGLDGTRYGAGLSPVMLPAAERPGFLTRADFLASFATSDSSSPIRRGAFVMLRLLGVTLGTPPPTTGTPPLSPTDGFLTNRARTEALTAAPACATCHETFINPPGFVLEAYDGIGARQTKDPSSGAPIDTAAIVVIDGANVPIRDPAELMSVLARSVQAQRTYASRLVSYAYGREQSPLDACTVDALTANITRGGYRIVDLLVDLTQTEAFKLRAREVTP
jgi:hypothetical protein